VDHVVNDHLDDAWRVIEEEAQRLAGGGLAGAETRGARANANADADATGEGGGAALGEAGVANDSDSDGVPEDDDGVLLESEPLGRRGELGWRSYAEFEDDALVALEMDDSVTIVPAASRALCEAVARRLSERNYGRWASAGPGNAGAGPPRKLRATVVAAPRFGEPAARRRERPALGARVAVPLATVRRGIADAIADAKGKGAEERTPGDGSSATEDAAFRATVVRHRASNRFDAQLDDSGAFVENLAPEDVRAGDDAEAAEEAAEAAADLAAEAEAVAAANTGRPGQPGQPPPPPPPRIPPRRRRRRGTALRPPARFAWSSPRAPEGSPRRPCTRRWGG
jgi:hypothetical protein